MELNEAKTNKDLTMQGLLDWEYNLTDQQRAFITRNIEYRAINRVANDVERFEPAVARLLRQYAE